MLFILVKIGSLFFKRPAFASAFAVILAFVQSGYAGNTPEPASLDTGFRQMYNLDFAAAHRTFEAWRDVHPEDPLGAASNAAAYLFAEFERLHILEFDLFTENKPLNVPGRPDPVIKAAFESELARADDISGKILAQSTDNRDALFARTLTNGLRGNYAALVEKQQRAGLNFLKLSRGVAEKLIAVDPTYNDAYLAIGIENYMLGTRSAPARWLLRASGAQTDKEKGIANIVITAEKGRYLAPYARLLLAIAALRDHDQSTARKLLTALAREFPGNRLYEAELARLQS